ncbi:MAG: D-2-hydroxyacid dehydrogenase [Coriobacteriia bacterium]|nr:D-2-hydroxyacid dehydrogenase [Coriobacteriia bacterium]
MNIAILDAQALNPGDLDWSPLEQFGTVHVYPLSTREQLPARVLQADILVVNKIICDKQLLDWAPSCKMIAVTATGFNIVDLEECVRRGIVVSNVPAYSTPDVVQHTFALLFELALHVGKHSDHVMAGGWAQSPCFTYSLTPLMELSGKTLGIVGMGSIGQAVAQAAKAFGMNVVFNTRRPKPECVEEGISQVDFDQLLEVSDVVTLHAPATPQTIGLFNAETLARMKDGAILLNTARGNLVVEQDVAAALKSGKLAGFGADVVATEPMAADNPLLGCQGCNIVITPHVAWATYEARVRCMQVTLANVKAFVEGNPQNVVG